MATPILDSRKQLFASSARPRRRIGLQAADRRLLNGHALAQAQRLAHATVRPGVLRLTLALGDTVALALTGFASLAMVPALDLAVSTFALIWLGALLVVVALRILGAYRLVRMRALWQSVPLAIAGLGLGLGALAMVLALSDLPAAALQSWLVFWGATAGVLMLGLRLYMWMRIRHLTRSGQLEHRIVLVGAVDDAGPLIAEIDAARGHGRRLCGLFDPRMDGRAADSVAGHHRMGDLDDLIEFARLARIDTVIVALPQASAGRLMAVVSRLFVLPVDIRRVAVPGERLPRGRRVSRIGRTTLVEIHKRPIQGWQAIQKRGFDLVVASLAIIAFAPVMLACALAVRLESPGPILFRQQRHGFNNRPIWVWKFRSMYVDRCDPSAVKAVRRGDARVTRVGRFLRRTSLDELPQFFNVLAGDLSVVGPRPHATAARTGDILYDTVVETYSGRHKVKPGITGWAQVNGWRGELNSPDKIRARIEHDLYYIEHWSLWMDIRIVAMTPLSLITTKNAY